jgi:hypothetical protein
MWSRFQRTGPLQSGTLITARSDRMRVGERSRVGAARTGPAGNLNYNFHVDPPGLETFQLGAPYRDPSWSMQLLPNPALTQCTRIPPLCRENWVLETKGRFGQVLNTRWGSREDLLSVGRMVCELRNDTGDRVEEDSVAPYQGREIWLPFWCTPQSKMVVIHHSGQTRSSLTEGA